MTVRNKETGRLYEALALDDFFGRREYGYSVIGWKDTMKHDEFYKLFERVEQPNEL